MTITREDLEELRQAGVIDGDTARRIAEYAGVGPGEGAGSDGTNAVYYLGAGLVVAAMTWLLTEVWFRVGGLALAGGALVYGAAFWWAADDLHGHEGYRVPAGLLFMLAVWTVPLVVFGLQDGLGLWPSGEYPGPFGDYGEAIQRNWLTMEAGLVLVAVAAQRYRPSPFVNIPLVIGLWFLAGDMLAIASGVSPGQVPHGTLRVMTLVFGGLVTASGLLLERRTEQDHAAWLYGLGLLSFWSALTGGGIDRLPYPAANVLLLTGGLLLRRRVFLIFGAMGVFVYLAYLSNEIFADSLLFPVAITVLGVGIFALGLWYRRNEVRIGRAARQWLPDRIRRVLPS